MEDLNMIAADCIVLSCCCECLVLQIVIFVLLKLPYKMILKTRAYARKRLRLCCTRKRERRSLSETCDYRDRVAAEMPILRVQVEEFMKEIGVHGFGGEGEFCCMQQVEKVLEDLSENGGFGFGSFWGREESAVAPSLTYACCFQSRI